MSSTSVLSSNFDQVFNLYNPLVYEVADVIDTYVYRTGIGNFQYEFATAVGLLRNVISFILLIIANSIAKRVSEYSIW
jgi:putative aldouronate transport system permease protein